MIKNQDKNLLDIESLSASEVNVLIQRAIEIKQQDLHVKEDYSSKIIVNAFFEDSTRTHMSFEMAAKRLGIKVVNWASMKSSMSKGETFGDTVANLGALNPDVLVIRCSDYEAPYTAANLVSCPVVNAGDSWRAHPSQALIDAVTMVEHAGALENLTIAICGDVMHSRVARSNMKLLSKMGAQVHVVAPPALMPREKDIPEGIKLFSTIEEGIAGCDVVMALRLQKERMKAALIPNEVDYHADFGLTYDRLKHAKPKAFVMHPGPMNRGVEIEDVLADDPERSLILKQVANGVPMRMAIFERALKD